MFVLDDGGEADLDLGNYERYLDVTLSKDNNITTGKIYRDVIEKEVSSIFSAETLQHKTDRNDYSAKATILERPFKSFHMSRVQFKTGLRELLEYLPTKLARKQMSVSLRCVVDTR